jgi:hypothetical protein
MSEFTEFDFRTPEQKIAANNARIQELKNRKAQLEAKRNQMKVASNRARAGDASFVHTMFANEADQENVRRKELQDIQEDVYLREYELKKIDEKLSQELPQDELERLQDEKDYKLGALKRVLARNPEVESHYYDRGQGSDKGGKNVASFKQEWAMIKPSLTNDQKVAFLGKLKDYRAKYKNVEGLNDLINEVENTPTNEEKDEEKRLAGIAIDKVIKGGVDYATLDKKGSYTKSVKIGKEFYDVVVNSNGTATCKGVKREW